MADTTIQKQGEIFISQSEYDALRLAGNLQSNTKYHITKTPKTGVDSLEQMNLLNGDKTVTYDTTNGMTVNGTARFTYPDGNHDANMAIEVPIVAGEGIVIAKKASEEKVEVKLDTELTDGKYVPKTTDKWRVYATNGQGNQVLLNYTAELGNSSLITRDGAARAKINTPTDPMHIANKKYVDDGFVPKTSRIGIVYCTDNKGNQAKIDYSENAAQWTIAQRAANGVVRVGTPEGQNDATTKKYVDDGFVAKRTGSDATVYVYGYNNNGDVAVPTSFGVLSDSVVVRDSNGNASFATPTSSSHATTKAYVDAFQTVTILGADE